MKKADLAASVEHKKKLGEHVLDELVANPNVWFDITDESNNVSIRTALYHQAGRRFTPLEVIVRDKAIYARWASKDKA